MIICGDSAIELTKFSEGIACKKFNRDFIGIEIDKQYFNIAQEKLQQ